VFFPYHNSNCISLYTIWAYAAKSAAYQYKKDLEESDTSEPIISTKKSHTPTAIAAKSNTALAKFFLLTLVLLSKAQTINKIKPTMGIPDSKKVPIQSPTVMTDPYLLFCYSIVTHPL
jgi:hypothetical protein